MKRFKVFVEPFANTKYHIAYTNSFGLFYSEICYFYKGSFRFPELSTLEQPYLFTNYESAIEFANKFQTIQDVKQHKQIEKEKWTKWWDDYNEYVKKYHANKSKRIV